MIDPGGRVRAERGRHDDHAGERRGLEQRPELVRERDVRVEVRLEHALGALGVDVEARRAAAGAGVVDEPVEPAEAVHLGDDRRAALLGRDVGRDADHAELGDERIEPILAACAEHDLAAASDELAGDAEADAGAAAGDERDGLAHAGGTTGSGAGYAPWRQARAATLAVMPGAAPWKAATMRHHCGT